jgi:hypothetical protein
VSLDTAMDNKDLEQAVQILEFPTFTAKVTKFIGKPMELALDALPNTVKQKVGEYTEVCMKAAFHAVLLTVNKERRFQKAHNLVHKGLVTATGAAGGFFGGLTMALELPVSTGIMMRSIAEIAREKGEDLTTTESRLECISVLGLDTSSQGSSADTNSSRYFYVRSSMAKEITKAAEYLAANAIGDESAPVVVQFLSKVAERFGIQLSDKMAAELVPIVGAVAGGGINLMFIDHFQRIATGHFTVRKLERKYGQARVQTEYQTILNRLRAKTEHIVYQFEEVAATAEE